MVNLIIIAMYTPQLYSLIISDNQVKKFITLPGLVLKPHPRGEARGSGDVNSVNPSGFNNIDYILGKIFHPPITLHETQSVVATPETLGYFSIIRNLVISC